MIRRYQFPTTPSLHPNSHFQNSGGQPLCIPGAIVKVRSLLTYIVGLSDGWFWRWHVDQVIMPTSWDVPAYTPALAPAHLFWRWNPLPPVYCHRSHLGYPLHLWMPGRLYPWMRLIMRLSQCRSYADPMLVGQCWCHFRLNGKVSWVPCGMDCVYYFFPQQGDGVELCETLAIMKRSQ